MTATIATLICALGIAGLFWLNREKTPRVSWALWLPGLWIGVVGSRPVSEWLGFTPAGNAQMEGSPIDAAFFGVLLAIAIVILIHRRARTSAVLFANRAILIYFLYCLISVAWSYYPDVSLKRWIKAIGDLAMVLIIATDEHPVAAIRRTVSYIGFLLLPTSLLFIRYLSDLGRRYNSLGELMNTGVTTNKNSLGLTTLLISLVVVWNLRWLLTHKDEANRERRIVAQGVLLAFGLVLLWMAQCSTCIASFVLGSLIIVASTLRAIRKRPARIRTLFVAGLLVAGITMLSGGIEGIIEALGRESDMSGRTEIWAAVLPAAPNPIVGAGFEGFWISPNARKFQLQLIEWGWYPALVERLNEAHNGYIETYLNLGWIGVCLIVTILIAGFRSSFKAFQRDPELGNFSLAFVVVAMVYGITEAAFRMLNPAWIFLLLAMVSASRVTTSLSGARKTNLLASRGVGSRRAVGR